MKIIELIGPSGVGKSTFYRNLRQKGLIADWPVPEEAARRILKENPERKFGLSAGDRFLLEQKLNSPRLHTMTALEKYDYLGFCLRKMRAESIIRAAESSQPVFGENHIFHGFNLELLTLAQRSDEEFSNYLPNRKFILLQRTHDEIIDNRLKRAASGEFRPGMTRFDRANEWASIEIYYERMKMLEGLFITHEVPYISITLGENSSAAEEKVTAFIAH